MPGVPSGGEDGQFIINTSDGTAWSYVHMVTEVVNNASGGTLGKGTPVHITGEDVNGNPTVIRAKADDAATMPCHFVLNESIANGATGEAILSGMIQDVNTTGFSSGDALFVGTGSDLYTTTKPTGTNLIQKIAVVSHVDASQGTGYIMGAGRTNDVPNIPDGQAWIGNSSGVATPTTLADVATSGAYSDLTGTPTINNNVTTDLSTSYQSDRVTVVSSDGTNAVILEANGTDAGVMTAAMHDKLDGIEAGADVTDEANVNAAGAIMHTDLTANGFVRRTAAETYDQINPGTGLSVSGSDLNVSTNSRLDAVDNTGDVDIKVTGPSGIQDSGVNLDSANSLLTIAAAANTITFTVDSDLSNYTSNFIALTDLSASAGNVGGITLNYDNSTGVFSLGGTLSASNQDLSLGTVDADSVEIAISDGNNVEITEATDAQAGVMTVAMHDKLEGIEAFAEVNVNADWNATSGDAEILNKPAIPTVSATSLVGSNNSGFNIQMTGADGSTDDILFTAGTDITFTNITAGGVQINSTAASVSSLNDLSDVTITGPLQSNDYLVYDGSNYVDQPLEIVHDTTPQLGGALDVNGYDIVSVSNGHIDVIPHGTGQIFLGSNNTTNVRGDLTLRDDDQIRLGANADLTIYHDAAGTDHPRIVSKDQIEIDSADEFRVEHSGEVAIRSVINSTVELYHNNSKKIETTTTGVKVQGDAELASGYLIGHDGVKIKADASTTAAGDHSGAEIIENFFTTGTVAGGKIYYAGAAAWALADKDAASSASGLLAIATSDNDPGIMITKGIVRMGQIGGTTPAKGDIVYVGDSGVPTVDAPSADGDIVRIVGYVYNPTTRTIFFAPSPDFIEVA